MNIFDQQKTKRIFLYIAINKNVLTGCLLLRVVTTTQSHNIKGVTIYIFVTSFSTLANFIRIQHFGSKTTISGLRNTNKHLFLVHSCSIVNILCNIQGKILRVESSWNLVAIENALLRHLIFNTQTKCHF